jgi:hypothetical protein
MSRAAVVALLSALQANTPSAMMSFAMSSAMSLPLATANLALGPDGETSPQPQWATPRRVALELKTVRKVTADCRHLGLFMGQRVLRDVWPRLFIGL